MKLDIQTLAFILSLTIVTQVIAIFIQYRVNRSYRGIGWWLLGAICMALGFNFLALGQVKIIGMIGFVGNPLLVFGRICFLVGTVQFVGKKENWWTAGSILLGFIIVYYYFMFADKNIAGRTVAVSAAIAIISFMTAYCLFFKTNSWAASSAKFTATVFLVQGLYLVLLVLYTLLAAPIHSYIEYSPIQVAAFIVPTLTSTLWTFGFILMVNQRLSSENKEETEKLQRIFNTNPDATLITRLEDGLLIDANFGFTAMTGHVHADIIGKSTTDIHLWAKAADRSVFIDELRNHDVFENGEFVFQRRDGTQFTGLISARTIATQGSPHIVSVIRDITERRLAEEALRESEETYRSILNASPDDITITDLEGRILMVSPAAAKMFGYQEDEGFSSHLLDFIVPEEMERARSNIRLMFQGGLQGPNDYHGVRKDQSVFDIEVNSGVIHDGDGKPRKLVFVVRDITERRKAEAEKAELESKNRQLQKAESLGRMAGAIAHHFNNQLQAVMANLELLGELPKGAVPARYLTRSKQAVERAAEVSRLMLAYLGQTSREQEPQFLSELCRVSLAILQGTQPKGVILEADYPLPGPVISANASQVQQIVTNLVTNAWEAMGERSGKIRLSVSTCSAAEIPAAHRFPIDWEPQAQDYACLEVMDAGCGIPEADIEKLFDPFFSTRFTGRGLGLSMVLGTVKAHGGAVAVESTLDQGSVFRTYLPLTPQAGPSPMKLGAQPPAAEMAGTVLLVDDDEDLLGSTGALIEMMGFQLLTAKDGVEAIEVFQKHKGKICCVITDLTMPRMDGWETLTALRHLDPSLPVILASGYDKGEVMAGAHPERPQAFLGKPFGLQQLRDVLSQVLVIDGNRGT